MPKARPFSSSVSLTPSQRAEVHGDGRREPSRLTHDAAFSYAAIVANDFGVGESRTVGFDKKLAAADVKAK